MAKDGRLDIRINKEVLDRVQKYASRNGTTVSALVDRYFRDLIDQDEKAHLVIDAEQL